MEGVTARMDVAWLESLLALVEHGSFTRAAQAQHMSQPAFSRRIRSLEQWLGADLLDRSTFPVQLTSVGVEVAAYARETVAGLSSLRDEARGRATMPRGAVRIAISHTLAMYYFSRWWVSLQARDPMPCQLLPANTLEAYDSLLHGGCDLLVAYADPQRPLPIDHDEVQWVTIGQDHLAPYGLHHDGRPVFTLPGTADRPVPFVSHGSGAFLGRITDRVVAPLGLHLRPVAQSDLTAALMGLVLAGMGVGWLPGLAVNSGITGGSVGRVGRPEWAASLEIRLYRRRAQHPTRQAETVWRRANSR